MAKHTYVIELDTTDLTETQFDQIKGNLLSRIVADTATEAAGSCVLDFDKHQKVKLFCDQEVNPMLDLRVQPQILDITNPLEIEEIQNRITNIQAGFNGY